MALRCIVFVVFRHLSFLATLWHKDMPLKITCTVRVYLYTHTCIWNVCTFSIARFYLLQECTSTCKFLIICLFDYCLPLSLCSCVLCCPLCLNATVIVLRLQGARFSTRIALECLVGVSATLPTYSFTIGVPILRHDASWPWLWIGCWLQYLI